MFYLLTMLFRKFRKMGVTVVLENFTESGAVLVFRNNRLGRDVALNLQFAPGDSVRIYTQDGGMTEVCCKVDDAVDAADFFTEFDNYLGWDFIPKPEECRGYVRDDGTVVK